MLQLHTGPWLCDVWGKRDIYFLQYEDKLLHTEQPFLLSRFSGHEANKRMASQKSVSRGCNSSLLSLGILILELWFNERIESHPLYSNFQNSNGSDNDYTAFNTAQRWRDQAMEEAGLDLHNPTR